MVARKKKEEAAPAASGDDEVPEFLKKEARWGANAHGQGPDTDGGPNPDYQPPEGGEPAAEPATEKPKGRGKKAEPPKAGDNSGRVLVSFAERIERLMEERDALNEDIREVYAELKSNGFDSAIMRKVMARRRMDPEKRKHADELIDLYEHSLDPGGT